MNKLSHSEKYFLSQYKNLEKKAIVRPVGELAKVFAKDTLKQMDELPRLSKQRRAWEKINALNPTDDTSADNFVVNNINKELKKIKSTGKDPDFDDVLDIGRKNFNKFRNNISQYNILRDKKLLQGTDWQPFKDINQYKTMDNLEESLKRFGMDVDLPSMRSTRGQQGAIHFRKPLGSSACTVGDPHCTKYPDHFYSYGESVGNIGIRSFNLNKDKSIKIQDVGKIDPDVFYPLIKNYNIKRKYQQGLITPKTEISTRDSKPSGFIGHEFAKHDNSGDLKPTDFFNIRDNLPLRTRSVLDQRAYFSGTKYKNFYNNKFSPKYIKKLNENRNLELNKPIQDANSGTEIKSILNNIKKNNGLVDRQLLEKRLNSILENQTNIIELQTIQKSLAEPYNINLNNESYKKGILNSLRNVSNTQSLDELLKLAKKYNINLNNESHKKGILNSLEKNQDARSFNKMLRTAEKNNITFSPELVEKELLKKAPYAADKHFVVGNNTIGEHFNSFLEIADRYNLNVPEDFAEKNLIESLNKLNAFNSFKDIFETAKKYNLPIDSSNITKNFNRAIERQGQSLNYDLLGMPSFLKKHNIPFDEEKMKSLLAKKFQGVVNRNTPEEIKKGFDDINSLGGLENIDDKFINDNPSIKDLVQSRLEKDIKRYFDASKVNFDSLHSDWSELRNLAKNNNIDIDETNAINAFRKFIINNKPEYRQIDSLDKLQKIKNIDDDFGIGLSKNLYTDNIYKFLNDNKLDRYEAINKVNNILEELGGFNKEQMSKIKSQKSAWKKYLNRLNSQFRRENKTNKLYGSNLSMLQRENEIKRFAKNLGMDNPLSTKERTFNAIVKAQENSNQAGKIVNYLRKNK